MTRRELLSLAAPCALGLVPGRARAAEPPADFTIRIAEISLELGPGRIVKTLAYNGQSPGPLLRMKEGRPVVVEVVNESATPEMVHWHGFHIAPEVDGSHEEGTPMVAAGGSRRYAFTPGPTGTRWYHTHSVAGHDLRKASYSGQFGMVIVEGADNPGAYDLEVPVVLHEWDGFFSPRKDGDIDYKTFSVNGKILGAGEPIRVRPSQRVLFRILNASATLKHRLALPQHSFQVVALDGNPVATTASVPVLELGPAERIDALVEMKSPGVWTLGEVDERQRTAGAGIVVEYAGARGPARWNAPPSFTWDYRAFGSNRELPQPDAVIPLVFEPQMNGHLYSINGKSFPDTDPIRVKPGSRSRLVLDNRSGEEHPMHLHRHTFELARYGGQPTAGVWKDVVVVPAHQTVEVDLLADHPGPSLFHCHQQFHMDFGFMALMQY